uniref:Uncharacterized protein n=1 Tax=Panagrolaimus davidi TaxID=227884 RepID=A0A914Q055_9BILA
MLMLIDGNNQMFSLNNSKQSVITNGSITVFFFESKLGFKGAMLRIHVYAVEPESPPQIAQNSSHIGWDGIQQVSIDGYKCLAKYGFSFYIGRIYRSIGIPDIHGIQNIKNARAAGWTKVSGYIFPCLRNGCPRPRDQIDAAIKRVQFEGAQIDMLWISVRQNEWPADIAYNRLFIHELIKHAETMGVKVGIYTSRDNWDLIVGLEWNGAADKPLWYALFNGEPNFESFTPFGGWKKPSIHHFKVTAPGPCDVEMNYSWYP